MSISLDDFARDCFNLQQLLTENEIKFVLGKSQMSELSQESLINCLRKCSQLNQNEMIQKMYVFMWKGKVKSGDFKAPLLSLFFTLDFNIAIYKSENGTLRESIGTYELRDTDLQFNHRENVVEISVVSKGMFWNSKQQSKI